MSVYREQFDGYLVGALRWTQFDSLWAQLRASGQSQAWYIYALGEAPPTMPAEPAQLQGFLDEMDTLLRRDHDEDYCGIVYADSLSTPAFVKIYDPNNLGMVCGSSAEPVLPGWTLSLAPPEAMALATPPPAGRRRWWARLWGSG